ncbi:MAG: amidohydrolase [Pyrinomonadaceae bacterium]
MDSKRPLASAIAVFKTRIIAAGSTNEIRSYIGPSTKVIDANGKLIIPGFNDAHVHFTGVGNWFSHLDASNLRNSKELLDRVAHFSRFLPKGRWILGAKLSAEVKPSRLELDAVSSQNPVLIYLADPSFALVNSAAMRLVNLSARDTRSLIVSGSTLQAIRNSIPKNNATNWAEIAEAASNYAASLGVTSIQDMHSDNLLATYRSMAVAGKLKTRIYECVGLGDWEKDHSIGLKAATGDAMVRGGCVKWFSDGSVEERSELGPRIAAADKVGLQVMVHAIGTRANRNTIDAFKFAGSRNGKRDRRFRVEHGRSISTTDIARLSRSSIIASMQPALFYRDGDAGDDYPFILRSGAKVAFGSDASMIDIDPLAGIHAAVNSRSGSISVETAVSAYTFGSAYAEFQENEKGTLSVGKLADLVVLSDDIFSIPKNEIRNTRVLWTVVNGKVVYDANCYANGQHGCEN